MRIFSICLILSLAILTLLACEETLIDHDHPHDHPHDHETSEQSATTDPNILAAEQAEKTVAIMDRMFQDVLKDVELSEADIQNGGDGGITRFSRWH